MGANITPITKKSGRTVLGVRIGLTRLHQFPSRMMLSSMNPKRLTAMLSDVAVEKPCLRIIFLSVSALRSLRCCCTTYSEVSCSLSSSVPFSTLLRAQ